MFQKSLPEKSMYADVDLAHAKRPKIIHTVDNTVYDKVQIRPGNQVDDTDSD